MNLLWGVESENDHTTKCMSFGHFYPELFVDPSYSTALGLLLSPCKFEKMATGKAILFKWRSHRHNKCWKIAEMSVSSKKGYMLNQHCWYIKFLIFHYRTRFTSKTCSLRVAQTCLSTQFGRNWSHERNGRWRVDQIGN